MGKIFQGVGLVEGQGEDFSGESSFCEGEGNKKEDRRKKKNSVGPHFSCSMTLKHYPSKRN
jgi:hypothetical protein